MLRKLLKKLRLLPKSDLEIVRHHHIDPIRLQVSKMQQYLREAPDSMYTRRANYHLSKVIDGLQTLVAQIENGKLK